MRKSENFENKYVKEKTVEYRDAALSICAFKYSVPKRIPIAFDDVSNYDFHFIIKELAEEFDFFACLGENIEKYITLLSSLILSLLHIEFTDSARFIVSSLSNLVNNLSERIDKIKCR